MCSDGRMEGISNYVKIGKAEDLKWAPIHKDNTSRTCSNRKREWSRIRSNRKRGRLEYVQTGKGKRSKIMFKYGKGMIKNMFK